MRACLMGDEQEKRMRVAVAVAILLDQRTQRVSLCIPDGVTWGEGGPRRVQQAESRTVGNAGVDAAWQQHGSSMAAWPWVMEGEVRRREAVRSREGRARHRQAPGASVGDDEAEDDGETGGRGGSHQAHRRHQRRIGLLWNPPKPCCCCMHQGPGGNDVPPDAAKRPTTVECAISKQGPEPATEYTRATARRDGAVRCGGESVRGREG